MAVSLKHTFVSPKVDGTDSTLIQPSNWNQEHTLTLAAGKVLGRDASGSGVAQELAISVDATQQSMIPPSGTTAARPASPVAGMMRYNTTTSKFEGYTSSWGTLGGGAYISDTAPPSPQPGDLWWKSNDGQMYIYYDDGTSLQWVIANYFTGAGTFLPLTGGTVTGDTIFNGNVGIGTTPSAKLHLLNTTAVNTELRIGNSVSYASVLENSVGEMMLYTPGTAMTFSTNGLERMRIDSAGNVGIGTSSPTQRFDNSGSRTALGKDGSNMHWFVTRDSGSEPNCLAYGFNSNGTSVQLHVWKIGGADVLKIDASGNILNIGSGGLGYGTGSGGTVTQATSKATGITLNKTNGQITMNNAALAASTTVAFTFLNSTIAASDTVFVTVSGGVGNGASYQAWTTTGAAGSCGVYLRNISGGSLSEAVVLTFVVIKAVTA